MKKILPLLIVVLLAVFGCEPPKKTSSEKGGSSTGSTHDHSGHDHDGHDHSGHDHSGHDHDGHDHNGHSHDSDPIPAGTTEEIQLDVPAGTTEEIQLDVPAGTTEPTSRTDSVSSYVLATINESAPKVAVAQQPIRRVERALNRAVNSAVRPAVPAAKPNQPRLFCVLPEYLHNPDGMTVSDDQQTIYMCNPNFNNRANGGTGAKDYGAFLVSFDLGGRVTKLLEFPVLEETGQTGAMGLDFGPDGHLYVCDNQYFFNTDSKSRILRVVMKGKRPTGEVQVVIKGLKLPNAILWMKDKLLFTDTCLDLKDKEGAGGVWMFSKEEVLKAGTKGNPTIEVKPNGTDPHLIIVEQTEKIGRGERSGADGMTCTPDGVVYFGNFGDGAMYRIEFDANNKPTCEKIHKAGEVFECCDGIFYDKRTDKIYICDSQVNAIRAFKPVKKGEKPQFEVIWENGDCDGSNGLLDQPCECVVIGKSMIICNFDWPFPGLINSKFDKPNTMSIITLK